ncbi:MAG: CPBP family intramembrane metalloprotease [Proteobacteria bacterium]|nr:CPBP family intramembrane metalloprotease [Pseudomonadota bacterium]
MTLTLFDHLFVSILAAWMPIQGSLRYRRLIREVTAGTRHARLRAYRRSLAWEWSLALTLVVGWIVAGRPLAELGLGLALDWQMLTGVGLTTAACTFLIRQMSLVTDDQDASQKLSHTMRHLRPLIPSNRREMRVFVALSVTAGICEELLYRGFLLWYLGQITTTWMAVIASSFIFGAGHAYQGGRGIATTGLFGLVAAGLYLLTGSLWAPMVLHAVLDITSGNILRQVLHPRDRTDA